MQIKQFDKQGIIAWSNSKVHSQLLASAAIQKDNGFFYLDILSLDLQQRSRKINVIGNGYTDTAFRCVAWDNFGEKDNLYSHGLIFTGQDDCSFKLWNPAEMIATYPSRFPSVQGIAEQTCLVHDEELELEGSFPIMCAEWNTLSNHMLAFGTTDVYILLVDKNPEEPDIRKPGKKNPHNGSYVTSVSWNREVPHILASASENGLVALWDIKTNNSIFQFRDSGTSPSGERNVDICWSKNISTQIAVTLDDEKHNQLQIWDLRNQKGPVVVIDKCHSKGINAMDWCETDPELILTASRDKKVVCWNYTQEEEPLSETALESKAFSVKWSKKLPSIYSVCTEEKTLIYSLNDANLFSYVPKWYKVPVGSSLLGNESLVTYSEQKGNVLQETKLLDHNRHSTLRPKLKALAEIAEKRFDEENDSELATLIKAKSGENDTEIFDYLGFSKSKIVQEVEKYTGKKREFAAGSQKEKSTKHKPKAYTQIQGLDALAFFASINTQSFEQNANHEEDQNNDRVQYDMVPRNFNWDLGKERLVKQNILIGNYEGAIDAALKCGRTAQALIIAYSCGQNLFSNTLKTFFTQTTDSFITDVLKHIAYKDAFELVKKYDLNKWKECIALILSFASSDRRPELLKLLAKRLRTQSQQADVEFENQVIPESYAAIICCVLAEDFNLICEIYYENLTSFASGTKQRKEAVIEYARRLVLIYENLTIEVADQKIFQKIIREVSFIAIEEHEKVLAHQLLTSYANNSHKALDYLVNSTKELNKYKATIKYKTTVLPIMQIKKQEKKGAAKGNEQVKQPQKPKVKIFEKEEQVKPPPVSHPPKKKVEESSEGFSPFNTQKPPEPAVFAPKKNMNTPPPMPVPNKKPPVVVSQPEEEEEPKRVEPTKAAQKTPPPAAKKVPPPPPPQAINTSYQEQKEEAPQNRSIVVERPAIKSPPPPPPTSQKKIPPPVMIKPPVQKSQVERYESEQDQQLKGRIPPPSKPAPTRHQEVEQTNEPNYPKKQLPRPPPPKQEEAPKSRANLPPPSRFQQKREEEKQVVSEPIRKTVPPPPPVKKNVPPPPMRK